MTQHWRKNDVAEDTGSRLFRPENGAKATGAVKRGLVGTSSTFQSERSLGNGCAGVHLILIDELAKHSVKEVRAVFRGVPDEARPEAYKHVYVEVAAHESSATRFVVMERNEGRVAYVEDS